jgi:hypothetical protein
MGVEDQQEEREVLESIFPEEITGMCRLRSLSFWCIANSICADVSETEFRVLIKLDVAQDEEDEADEDFEGRTLRISSPCNVHTANGLQHPSSSTSSTPQTTPTKPPDST